MTDAVRHGQRVDASKSSHPRAGRPKAVNRALFSCRPVFSTGPILPGALRWTLAGVQSFAVSFRELPQGAVPGRGCSRGSLRALLNLLDYTFVFLSFRAPRPPLCHSR